MKERGKGLSTAAPLLQENVQRERRRRLVFLLLTTKRCKTKHGNAGNRKMKLTKSDTAQNQKQKEKLKSYGMLGRPNKKSAKKIR